MKNFSLNEFEEKLLENRYKMVILEFSPSINDEEGIPVKETKIEVFRDKQRVGFTYSSKEKFTWSSGVTVIKKPMKQLCEEIQRSVNKAPEEVKKWEKKQMK